MSIIKNYKAKREAKRKRKVQQATKAYDAFERKKDAKEYKVIGRQMRNQAAYKRLGVDQVAPARAGIGLAAGMAAGAGAPLLFYSNKGRKIISRLTDKGRLGKLRAKMLKSIDREKTLEPFGTREDKALIGASLGAFGGTTGGIISAARELERREKYATNKKDKLIFKQNRALDKYMKNRRGSIFRGEDPTTIPNDIKLAMERDPAFIRRVMKQYGNKR